MWSHLIEHVGGEEKGERGALGVIVPGLRRYWRVKQLYITSICFLEDLTVEPCQVTDSV